MMRTILALLTMLLLACSAPAFDVAGFVDPAADDAGQDTAIAESEQEGAAPPDSAAVDTALPPDTSTSHDSAAVDTALPPDTSTSHDSAAVDAALPPDTSTCAECYGTCSKPGEDHTCWTMCSAEGKHCTWSPGNCGCNK